MRTGGSRTGVDDRRRTLLLGVFAASGIVMLALVLLWLTARGGGGSAALASTLQDAGCTLRSYKAQSRNHVLAVPKGFKYNSFPPTSGPHHPEPAIWNEYDQPVEQLRLIHNLEHGGLVVQYGSRVPRSTVNELGAFYRSDPNGMILAPLPRLGNRITMAAWTTPGLRGTGRGEGRLATCTEFDQKAFEAFRDEYRGKGPERLPVSALQPGT